MGFVANINGDLNMKIIYKMTKIFDEDHLIDLYNDVKWTSYTNDIEKLLTAFRNSTCVISAWNNDVLVGVVRCLTDKESIMFIQDILVLSGYQRRGIGQSLIKKLLKKFPVRQTFLQTDATDNTSNIFYQKLGFSKTNIIGIQSYLLIR